ncbi:MAG: hypothetical protein V7606_3364, partial [Burkholderiales bacterium]
VFPDGVFLRSYRGWRDGSHTGNVDTVIAVKHFAASRRMVLLI